MAIEGDPRMKCMLRVIVTESDSGVAGNLGGPVHVTHKTFDVPCPDVLRRWLEYSGTFTQRTITGVEVRYED